MKKWLMPIKNNEFTDSDIRKAEDVIDALINNGYINISERNEKIFEYLINNANVKNANV